MFELFMNPETYISLLSLTLLEIVLGIDNIIFISILAGKLPEEARDKARRVGLMVALVGRLCLLLGIAWLVKLTTPFLNLGLIELSGKDLVMLLGGLFLVAKSTHEIYEKVEASHPEGEPMVYTKAVSFSAILLQIILIDMVFSLDSIITAVGLVENISIMVLAILVSMGLMLVSSSAIGGFIDRHPSVKVLALSFLLMIGTMLLAEGVHFHIPKGYIYFSLVFAIFVEFINIKIHTRALPPQAFMGHSCWKSTV